jgi:hypothetical protein
MEWVDKNGWVFASAALAAVVALLVIYRRKIFTTGPTIAGRGPSRAEIARIEERVELSGVGRACVFFLLLSQVAVFIGYGSLTSSVQEAAIGTLWIALNVLFGIGVLAGRRSTYRVLRDQSLDERS